MANKKISELNNILSLNENDIIPIVDISEGETKKLELSLLMNVIYPIGSIIIKDNNTDYSNWLGFEWEKVFDGKVLVGQDTQDSDFEIIGNTGGEKTHTLTINEMPSHQHGIYYAQPNTADTTGDSYVYGKREGYNTNMIMSSGGNEAHNIMQPYQVVAYWKRIS